MCGLGRGAGFVAVWGVRWHLRMGLWLARMGLSIVLGPVRWMVAAAHREPGEAAKDQFAR